MRARQLSLAWILTCLGSAAAAADPALVADRVIVVGRAGDGAWTDAATEARADQHAELAAIVVGHRGRRRVVLAPAGITRVTLGGQPTQAEDAGELRVQWSTVEPHGFRTTAAKNGATSEFYSNVSTEPKTFGHWLGYDQIDYFERVVLPWGAPARIDAQVSSGEDGAQQVPGLGTVRFKVEVELAGATLASPGAEATDSFGVLPTVHRVSIRRGDDFLGWLSSYLLVPEVFGSAGGGRNHQTERYTGADCADVLVGAIRRAGRTELAYTNVASLPDYSRVIAGPTELDDHGLPARPITGVRAGDLIRIDYGGALRNHTPRDWDHVAALWEDRSDPDGPLHGGPDGQLDGFDLVIHMGHPRLLIEPLARQAPATIDVLRFRQK
jgi:hypothetical protein